MSEVKSTLKGGEFLIIDQDPGSVYVPEEATEEQLLMRDSVKEFIDGEVRAKGDKLEHQEELLMQAAELGLLGVGIPEEYGGMDMDMNSQTMLLDCFGGAGGSFNTSYAAHTGIGTLPILYFGTEEQKKHYLPKLTSGEWKAAYCLTEPGSGSDALAAKTKATLDASGKNYILEGQKMWISNAGFADIFIVFAQVDGDKFTGFIVDAHSPNIRLGTEEDKMGIKGSSTRQVFFEETLVPVENVLGDIGKGHLIAFNVLNIGRFKLGILTSGGSKKTIDIAVKYAKEREQFNVPIASFGAIKYKLAEMTLRTFITDSAIFRLSDMLGDATTELEESGMDAGLALRESAKEYAIECAILKVAGSEALDYAADELVQIHGGYGFSEEYPAAQIYRDSRINRIYEGTNEINRMLIVDMLLKKALKGELDIVGPAWEVQKELTKMPSFKTSSGAKYEDEIEALKNFKKIALMVAGAAAKYQMDGKLNLAEEQEVLMNAADIIIEIFTRESLLLRIQKLESLGKLVDGVPYESFLKLAFRDGEDRIVKYATDALTSFATGDEQKIMVMGLKRFAKYPLQNVKEERRKIADYVIENDGYKL